MDANLRTLEQIVTKPLVPRAAVAATWLALAVCLGANLWIDLRLAGIGRSDLQTLLAPESILLIPCLTVLVVGSALVLRRPRHPVGWLFLLLSLAINATALIDSYTVYGAIAKPGALPGADIVAVIGGSDFIVWIGLLALILLFTPSGRLTNPLVRAAVWITVAGALIGIAAGMFRPYTGDRESLGVIQNPWEVSRRAGLVYAARWAGIVAIHLGVIAGVVAVVARFRAARGRQRRQLRWLGMAAIPFALFVFGASVAAVLNEQVVTQVMACCLISIIPLAVVLSIEQHHLYDVDRLVSRAVTWVLLTAGVLATYVVAVVFVGQSIGRARDSAIPAVVATLAAVSIAAPLRRAIQNTLDRRFNRRRFETIAMLRAYAREPAPSLKVENALQAATGDPTLSVAYRIDERDAWVNEAGLPMHAAVGGVTVRRQDQTICVVGYDPAAIEREAVEAATAEVRAELENASLRAAIALQLVEVRESRARIVEAQQAERHRIERDLHDGAQQRLLGLAMQLRAAELSGDPERMRSAVGGAIGELQEAVQGLRELANGLRPAVLTDSGLAAALDELGARSPVPVALATTDERFAPLVEETAWFIACEAVANAVKHAAPHAVTISTVRQNGHLRLVIEDDGIGGADPMGSGLRGLADRAEVAGGALTVRPRDGRGTIVIAELPCAS